MKVRNVNPFRVWYYLRQGYGMYLVFFIAVGNMMVTTYYLAIKDVPSLHSIFSNFTNWSIFVIGVGIPLCVIMGYWHVKRSNAQRSQMEVETEINPYYYRLPPGFWREVFAPLYLELLRMIIKIHQKESLTDEELQKIKEIEKKLDLLIKGAKFSKDGILSTENPKNPDNSE